MTKNEIIKTINKLISEVKQANEINIDVVISDIKCFLNEDEFIRSKYTEKVEKYNSLRNTEEFQQDAHKLLNQIAKEHNINIDAITPILGAANKEMAETNLYFYNVDCYICFLSEDQQKFLNDINKPIPLLGRNLYIYEQVYETFKNKNLKNIKEYKSSKIKNMRIALQEVILNSYDYHFFDIESNLEQVQLLTQMKIACINMLANLRYNVKNSYIEKRKELTNDEQLPQNLDKCTSQEKEIYLIFCKNPHTTVAQVAQNKNISKTRVNNIIKKICNLLNLDNENLTTLRNFLNT